MLGRALARLRQCANVVWPGLEELRDLFNLQPQVNQAGALVACYLPAHAPTPRTPNQTYKIALRLNRGENVFTE